MSALRKTILTLVIILICVIVILAVALHKRNAAEETAQPTLPSSQSTPAATPTGAQAITGGMKTYDNRDSRYSIQYPADWEYDASAEGTVVFSGKAGTPSFYSTVNIQTILTKKTGGEYANIDQFITDIKKQATHQSSQVKFISSGPTSITEANGTKAQGKFLIFTYQYKDVTFKQWQIVVLRTDGQVFYAWAYTAPVQLYQNDLPIAQAMLKSWMIY